MDQTDTKLFCGEGCDRRWKSFGGGGSMNEDYFGDVIRCAGP